MSENNYAYRFKLIMLGDSGVGKTSLWWRYLTGDYFDEYTTYAGES